MKVLYADLMSWGHHAQYNLNNIRLLSELCNLHVYSRENYLDVKGTHVRKQFESKLHCFPNHLTHDSRIGYFLKTKLGQLKILHEVFQIEKKEKYDLILFSCIDMISFCMFTKFRKENIAFVDHAIHMTTKQKWQAYFWKNLNRRLKVCVLEEYFVEYIRNTLHCKNPIYLLKHPISVINRRNDQSDTNDKIIIFAPSNSNSMKFVSSLIDKRNEIPDNIKIVIKGNQEYKSNNLIVYSHHLEREVYDGYYQKGDYVLIPYDSDYNYRTSGVLFDAISMHKQVILQKGNTLEYYSSKYPELFYTYDNIEQLLIMLSRIKKDEHIDSQCFTQFINDYSDEAIVKGFDDLLKERATNI